MADSEQKSYQRRAASVLEGVEFGPKHVLTITDAEILALDDPRRPRVTPLLSMRDLPDERREQVAEQTAQRLFGDGHTADGTHLGGPESDAAEPTVRTVLRMRRSWLCLLVLDQNSTLGHDFASVYLRADGRALTELVDQHGQHRFSVMKRAVALDDVLRILTPITGVDNADEIGQLYPSDDWYQQTMNSLGQAKVASTVISRRQNRTMDRRREDRFALYNFDDRTEILAAERAGHVRLAGISRPTLRARLEQMTAPIDDESEPAP